MQVPPSGGAAYIPKRKLRGLAPRFSKLHESAIRSYEGVYRCIEKHIEM